ncbi:hypothetical protein HXX76_007381 [Chlamydomonas incerta]|uniref:Uncharacterized protein n=1 Tax=Chlamydomonas incerta TaxID=51695 RepID=A0A835TBU2_CHLIN|nr:hypothetical protein HXX76_007381 [Chlamydomonas incerta]|eukprot:KAG2435306.1 hypothetical protein HXX76_007381 [Chlamydomonas incerta]
MSTGAALSRALGRSSRVRMPPTYHPRQPLPACARVAPAACAHGGGAAVSGGAAHSAQPRHHVSRSQLLRAAGRSLLLLGGAAQLPAAVLPRRSSAAFAGASVVGSGSGSGSGSGLLRAASAMSTSAAGAAAGAGAGGSSPTGAIVVYVTVPNAEVGEALAAKLVEAKLAACVSILPGVTSVYFWDGKVNKDAELLLIIKSREELLPELTAFVRANHPYDEPEVIGLPVLGGSPSYLKWLMDNTNRG